MMCYSQEGGLQLPVSPLCKLSSVGKPKVPVPLTDVFARTNARRTRRGKPPCGGGRGGMVGGAP